MKTYETLDGLIFNGTISEFPDKDFTITVNTDQGTGGSDLEYDIEGLWVRTSTDGFIFPFSRHLFDPDSNRAEVEKTGSYTYGLNVLNIEVHREYGSFIEANSRDSGKRAVGGSTFAAFFRIGPPKEPDRRR